ncbi:MAG: ABC transporter permease [Candidatus Ancillula sp.]|jgi:ABC-2 type transport system permease protein|nr:ABC transporter permease [Candidatus Ancillula sp.]
MIPIVSKHEFLNIVKTKTFVFSTLFWVVLICVGLIISEQFGKAPSSGQPPSMLIAYEQEVEPIVKEAETLTSSHLVLTLVHSDKEGRDLVENSSVSYFVSSNKELITKNHEFSSNVLDMLNQASRNLHLQESINQLGLDNQKLSEIDSSAEKFRPKDLGVDKKTDSHPSFGIFTGIFLFIMLMLYGSLIATGAVQEKSSRIVEILLSTVKPYELMTGKILGIGAAALFQMLIVLAVALSTNSYLITLLSMNSLGAVFSLVFMVLWFLLGFIVLSALEVALASRVSRQEDIGSAISPLTFTLLLIFYAGIFLAPSSPDSLLLKVLEFLPISSPIIMPIAISSGVVSTFETVVSFLILVAFVPLALWFSGIIYKRSVLHIGSKLSLKSVFAKRSNL